MANKDNISDELLAAYLDGNTSEEETKQVLQALNTDKQLQKTLDIALKTTNIDSMSLDGVLEELQEAIAENTHNVWAEERMKQGWTYGEEWDEINKHDPCLLPYTALPESEKEYDRLTAFNTIKLVKKLGFDIIKRK